MPAAKAVNAAVVRAVRATLALALQADVNSLRKTAMTEIEQTKPFPLGRNSGPLRVLVQSVQRGFGVLAKEIHRRQAIRALRALDDHELQDIGLARSEIEAAVYGFGTAAKPVRI